MMLKLLRRIGRDIASGRNIEAYVVTGLALILSVIGVIDDAVSLNVKLAVMLAALALLVFKSTAPPKTEIRLDEVLRNRESYGSFLEFIDDASVLWIYGPSAVNVMMNSPAIEQDILRRSGEVRVLLQDPEKQASLAILHEQLDQDSDILEQDIARSETILAKMKKRGGKIEYRFLPYSPGFSMVMVDPDARNGRAIIEFFGYNNQSIMQRMHIRINREYSNFWFEYWQEQYKLMWDSARLPETD